MPVLRRLLTSSVAAALAVPAVLVAPVVTTGPHRPTPHVVAGHVREVALTMRSPVVALGQRRDLGRFSMVGVDWLAVAGQSTSSPVTARVRVHQGGHWGHWQTLEAGDTMPDQDHLNGHRFGTEPLWTGPADGVQVTAVRADGGRPRGLRLSLVDPGSQASDGVTAQVPPSSAEAETARPTIVSRKQWGAAEKYAWWKPEYASAVVGIVIHHTASTNHYTRAQAAQQVRAIFAYHARALDWGDIGYHYVVDRFGTIYEGRKGGIGSTVVGGHTYGFNHGSIGISLLGSYDTTKPSAAQMESVARISAWVLAQAHRSPLGTASYTVDQSKNPRYKKGRVVTTRVIVGHRDLYPTTCPGRAAYRLLPALRTRVDQLLGPEVADPLVTLSGPVLSVSATLRHSMQWTATATGPLGPVKSWSGLTSPAQVTWSLDGLPSGTYQVTMTSAGPTGATSTPAVLNVTVTATALPRLVLPTGLTVRALDGSVWRVDDGPVPGTQVRRPVPAWVLAGMGDLSSRLAGGVDDVLLALPVGAALPARDGALLDVDGTVELLSGGVLHPMGPLSQSYPTGAAQPVTAADVAGIPVGAAVPSSGSHLAGTVVQSSDGSYSVLVARSDGSLVRRRVVSAAALVTWSPASQAVPANSADLALPVDTWDRGVADGALTATSIVSRGLPRAIPLDLPAKLGLTATASDLDVGHDDGALPVPGVPFTDLQLPAHASVALVGVRKPTWSASWSSTVTTGADVAPAATDPARP